MSSQATLHIRQLQTHFHTRAGLLKAVDGVDITVQAGEIVGLVGESGSGKSVTGFSIMGLIDPPGEIVGGSIQFQGEELVGATAARMREIRGNRIAMIFQDPMMTLNPVLRVDTQMIEAIRAHRKVNRNSAREQAEQALAQVGIASPGERLANYPHQMSGGMRQRVAIAIALLNEPDLIIADEPTTALDVTIQAQILYEVQSLCARTGTALIWITHDLAVVAGLADKIAVMYAGRIVEAGATDGIIDAPRHPYTAGLLGSVPSAAQHGQRLTQIPGMAPNLADLPKGCAFQPRCQYAAPECATWPQAQGSDAERSVHCHFPLPDPRASAAGSTTGSS